MKHGMTYLLSVGAADKSRQHDIYHTIPYKYPERDKTGWPMPGKYILIGSA
jgi:hypothetical protein